MTSCNLCVNGWTPEGKVCPNGCRDVSLRSVISAIPPQTNAPNAPENSKLYPLWPPTITPPMAKQMRFPPEPPTEQLLGLLRLLSAIMLEDPMTAVKFPPRKQAHLEWCDNVLAAQTDEGAFDPPHVLLNRALIELQRVVAGVTPEVQTEGGPDHDYRLALYKIINVIESAKEQGYLSSLDPHPNDPHPNRLLSEVLKIASNATAYD